MKTARFTAAGILTVLILTALFIRIPFQFAQTAAPNDAYLCVGLGVRL